MTTHGLSGMLPNIYYRSVDMDRLRAHPNFVALPPVDSVTFVGPPSYRFVRQDSTLWDVLHDGVLTTGSLNAALGFYEPQAARRLHMAPHMASHGPLLRAYHRICLARQEPYPAPMSPAEAMEENRTFVLGYNGSLPEMPPSLPPPNLAAKFPARAADGATAPGHRRRRQRKSSGIATAAAVAEAAELEARTQRSAKYLGESGLGSVRCSWGSAQEPASLYSLMAAFPTASVEEAGLCLLDPAELPPHWGFGPGSLPHIGASPDAMLRHRPGSSKLPFKPSPAAATAPAVAANTRVLNPTSPNFTPAPPVSPALTPLAPAAAALPAEWGERLLSSTTGSVSPSVVSGGGARCRRRGRNGTQSSGAESGETQTGLLDAQGVEDPAVDPTMGLLSADIEALLKRLSVPGSGDSSAPAVANSPQSQSADQSRGSSIPSANTADAAVVSAAFPGIGDVASGIVDGSGEGGWGTEEVLEAVELKNTCPFQTRSRTNASGKRSTHFVLDDRGPRSEVPPYWVPQLQMEMLAAGTPSVLLFSRSATEGINLFRMHRDEKYLRLMLQYVSKLWMQYALPQHSPPLPHDIWWNEPDYQELLSRTVALARATPLLSHIAEPVPHPDANDGRLFLD